jgi:iron(III) transport system substrate-binding protein
MRTSLGTAGINTADNSRWLRTILLLAVAAIVAGLGAGASAPARAASEAREAPAPKQYTATEWAQLVTRAKREGTVTLYTTQIPALLAELATAFERKYGIKVTVNRQVDQVLLTQINAGFDSGNVQADVWIANSRPYVLGALKNGWVADARGPHFFDTGFDRKQFAKPGKAWIVGAAILGYGWNTQHHSRGLGSFRDLADASLAGRLGVLRPASPAAVDYWYWIRENLGAGFIERLAALKPRIYVSAIPMQQALASGEIAAGSFITTTVRDLISQGAPIQFKLPAKAWNSPWFAMILKQAPHPAAAQLLADYLASAEGQAVINRNGGAIRKNVRGTDFITPRITKLSELTPQKVTEFQNYWSSLFQ